MEGCTCCQSWQLCFYVKITTFVAVQAPSRRWALLAKQNNSRNVINLIKAHNFLKQRVFFCVNMCCWHFNYRIVIYMQRHVCFLFYIFSWLYIHGKSDGSTALRLGGRCARNGDRHKRHRILEYLTVITLLSTTMFLLWKTHEFRRIDLQQ